MPATLPDGTRAIVTSSAAARGYPNTGTDLHLTALRPDGTYITVFSSNVPTEVGPNSIGLLTRLQPPLSQTDLLKFATVFSY